MKKLILLLFFAGCILTLLDSCQSSDPEIFDCEISYKNDILPIINTSCGGGYCHVSNNSDGKSFFSEYENIKTVVDNGKLYEQVVILKAMPKTFNTEVTTDTFEEYRELFACWIEGGGLDN